MAPHELHTLPLDSIDGERPSSSRWPRLHRLHLAGAGALILALALLDPFMTAWVEDFKTSLTLGLSAPPTPNESRVNLAPPLSAYLPPQPAVTAPR